MNLWFSKGSLMAYKTDVKQNKAFNCSYLDEISMQGLFLRSKIPVYQKSVANNYVTIRRIFSYTIVQPKVTNVEYGILKASGLHPLEETDGNSLYKELMNLIEFSNSNEKNKRETGEKIFQIRVKELKYILANSALIRIYEFKDGYKVLEKYLEFIAG